MLFPNSVRPPPNLEFLGYTARFNVQFAAGRTGTQVIVPYREEDEARIFKPMGDLGQIVRMVRVVLCYSRWCVLTFRLWKEWDIRNEEMIAECLRHSDTVYNFVGRDYETK